MEPALECVLSLLDVALRNMENVEGSDFDSLLSCSMDHHEEVFGVLLTLYRNLDHDREDFEEIESRLEEWNNGLRNLIEKIEKDVNVERITKLLCNTVMSLSKEEIKTLNLKKERRIKNIKLKIDKLVIKLDEMILRLHQEIERNSTKFNEIDTFEDDYFEDIERRYTTAVLSAQQDEQQDNSSNISYKNTYNNELEKENKDETRNKENEQEQDSMKTSENGESQKEKQIYNITELNQNNNSHILTLSENNTIKIKKIDEFTKSVLENPEIKNFQQRNKERTLTKFEEERLDPANWIKFRYTLTDGEFSDMDLACMITTFKGSQHEKENIVVSFKSIDDFPIKLDHSLEVLSNIIQVEPAGLEMEYNNEVPWKISIPYMMIRNASKEVVILCYDMTVERHVNLETQELVFDDNKEGGFKLAEAILPSSSCICVVVSKRKIEKFKVDKRGSKYVSSIDPRVALTVPQHSVKIKVNIEISVLQIESSHLNELLSKGALNNLYSMSPVIDMTSDYTRNLLRTFCLQIPIPNIVVHSSRGRAVSARPQITDKVVKRSKSALTRQISSEEDPVLKVGMYNEQEEVWRINNNSNFITNKNKDSVEIELLNLNKQKLVVVRCDETFNDDHLNKSMEIINKNMETRVVQFLIRQHAIDLNRIVFVVATANRMDKVQKYLTQENFAEETSVLSSEFVIQERSELRINCKGNLQIEGKEKLTSVYNSQLPNRKEFWVKEIDRFAQKSKELYQGFVVISEVTPTNTNKLWESVINIPKVDIENKKESKILKDFDFEPTDIINKHYLRFLSQQLGKDWMALGRFLKVADVSIRRISNDPFIDNQTMAYECLLKWIKNSTVYSKKTVVMERALRSIGRFDLVQDLAKRVLN